MPVISLLKIKRNRVVGNSMKRLRTRFKGGETKPWSMVLVALIAGTTIAIVGMLSAPPSLQYALSKVSSSGYVVLATGEYADLVNRLDNISTLANAAVTNASNAVVAAQNAVIAAQIAAAKVDLFNSKEVFIFPNTTARVVLLISGTTNNFSAWVQLNDSGGNSLSSKFVSKSGYIDDIYVYGIDPETQALSSFNIELSYWNGSDYVSLGKVMFHVDIYSSTVSMSQIKSRLVPAGSTIYYRMQSTLNVSGILASFRYFYQ